MERAHIIHTDLDTFGAAKHTHTLYITIHDVAKIAERRLKLVSQLGINQRV